MPVIRTVSYVHAPSFDAEKNIAVGLSNHGKEIFQELLVFAIQALQSIGYCVLWFYFSSHKNIQFLHNSRRVQITRVNSIATLNVYLPNWYVISRGQHAIACLFYISQAYKSKNDTFLTHGPCVQYSTAPTVKTDLQLKLTYVGTHAIVSFAY